MKEYTAIIQSGDKQWEEHHGVPDLLDPEETVKTTLRMFNEQRKTNYTFVRFKHQRSKNIKHVHNWTKKTLVTERGGFDKMECTNCGATGKRYGMGTNGIKVDAKFDHKYCKK